MPEQATPPLPSTSALGGPPGDYQPLAVVADAGPHLTLQAGVMHAGRYWTTTSRRSFKAQALDPRPCAATAVTDDAGRVRVLSGTVMVLDPLRPWSALDDPIASLVAGPAIAGLALTHAREIVGYVQSARRVPLEWLPTHRVVVALHPTHWIDLHGADVVAAAGAWTRDGIDLVPGDAPARHPVPSAALPAAVRDVALADSDAAWLGLLTADGPAVLPGRWDPEASTITVAADALARLGAPPPLSACVTLDATEGHRPDDKVGVMLRGRAHLVDVADGAARLQMVTDRLTYWDGFETDTVAA